MTLAEIKSLLHVNCLGNYGPSVLRLHASLDSGIVDYSCMRNTSHAFFTVLSMPYSWMYHKRCKSDGLIYIHYTVTELREGRPLLWRKVKRKSSERSIWDSFLTTAPLYIHWFPIFAYDMYKKTKEENYYTGQEGLIEVKISDGTVKVIPTETLEQFVSVLQSTGFQDSKAERKTCLTLFTQAIDKFLFVGCDPSLYLLQSVDDAFFPALNFYSTAEQDHPPHPLLFCSPCLGPPSFNNKSEHTQDILQTYSLEKSSLILVLSYIKDSVALDVIIREPGNRTGRKDDNGVTYLEIKVCEVPVMSNELRHLLITLYGCVHSLIVQPVNDPDSLTRKCCDGEHSLLSLSEKPAVIHCKERNMVLKFYDTDFEQPPKEELLKAVDLPRASLRSLNDRIKILECEYVRGVNYPWNIHQVTALLQKIHQLHSLGFVHGDIRYINLIFTEDNAYILDLDMAAVENEHYRSGYNSDIKERHPEAMAEQPMKKSHDRYSLHFIITRSHLLHLSLVQKDIVEKLLSCEQIGLDAIELELEKS